MNSLSIGKSLPPPLRRSRGLISHRRALLRASFKGLLAMIDLFMGLHRDNLFNPIIDNVDEFVE